MEQNLEREGFGREVLSQADLLRLLVELGRSITDADTSLPQPTVPQNRRILEIMEYIDRNLDEEIDMDRLSEEFYISKYYMMRLFQRETGETIYNYLTQRRLLRARELMESGFSAMNTVTCMLIPPCH
jgi:transcriptional regulator GlxA family with amidase domain